MCEGKTSGFCWSCPSRWACTDYQLEPEEVEILVNELKGEN